MVYGDRFAWFEGVGGTDPGPLMTLFLLPLADFNAFSVGPKIPHKLTDSCGEVLGSPRISNGLSLICVGEVLVPSYLSNVVSLGLLYFGGVAWLSAIFYMGYR